MSRALVGLSRSVIGLNLFFCKQKTAYEMRISDWSSDVCSSDLRELDMRAEVADREFIARDDIALELRRDGQGGALRREQRIVGAVGARQRAVESVIGDRAEITADLGIIIAHACVDRESIQIGRAYV